MWVAQLVNSGGSNFQQSCTGKYLGMVTLATGTESAGTGCVTSCTPMATTASVKIPAFIDHTELFWQGIAQRI